MRKTRVWFTTGSAQAFNPSGAGFDSPVDPQIYGRAGDDGRPRDI